MKMAANKFSTLACLIYLFQFLTYGNCADALYQRIRHKSTGRYLSSTGTATNEFTGNEELFFFYDLGYGKTLMYTEPWLNTTSLNLKAMDIYGGCHLGATVKQFQLNKSPVQLWKIEDGVIYSSCNPDWILHVDRYGAQTAKDRKSVSEEEIKYEIDLYPAETGDGPMY